MNVQALPLAAATASRRDIKSIASDLGELVKLRIAASVTLSAVAGYIVGGGAVNGPLLSLVVGTLALAGASAALNQIQECQFDSLMERTRSRPLPSGRMSSGRAAAVVIILALAGLVLLTNARVSAALIGLLTMSWYNLVYTRLKRVTPHAVIFGAVTGALPPLIGWAAAGQALFTFAAIALPVFIFAWQIPHFWILLLLRSKEYRDAGFPIITDLLTPRSVRSLILLMLVVVAASGYLFPLLHLTSSPCFLTVYSVLAVWLLCTSAPALLNTDALLKPLFPRLLCFGLCVLILLCLEAA